MGTQAPDSIVLLYSVHEHEFVFHFRLRNIFEVFEYRNSNSPATYRA